MLNKVPEIREIQATRLQVEQHGLGDENQADASLKAGVGDLHNPPSDAACTTVEGWGKQPWHNPGVSVGPTAV